MIKSQKDQQSESDQAVRGGYNRDKDSRSHRHRWARPLRRAPFRDNARAAERGHAGKDGAIGIGNAVEGLKAMSACVQHRSRLKICLRISIGSRCNPRRPARAGREKCRELHRDSAAIADRVKIGRPFASQALARSQ